MSTRINVRWVASLLITKRAKEERTKQKKEIKGKIKQMAMTMITVLFCYIHTSVLVGLALVRLFVCWDDDMSEIPDTDMFHT